MNIDTWIRQPTTIKGLAVAAGTLVYALSHVATPEYAPYLASAAGVFTLVGIKDNTAVDRAVADIATGAPSTQVLQDFLAAVLAVKGLAPDQAASPPSPPVQGATS